MKKTLSILIPSFLLLINLTNAQWVQLGNDMSGDGDFEFGNNVDFNRAGDIMIGGANGNYAKVYKEESGVWTQLGNTLTGPVGEGYGWAVSINGAGDIIAVGEFDQAGKVHLFELINNVWTPLGSPILGGIHNGYFDNFGYAVALNEAGDRVVASSQYGNLGNGVESGFVNVYDLVNGEWEQVGSSIEGQSSGQHFGVTVETNGAGNRLVVGTDGGAGGAYVYEEDNGVWQQLGQSILSSEVEGTGLVYVPTIDKIGNTIAFLYYGNTSRTWVYTLIGNSWTPKGSVINLGNRCSLNGDGNIVAVSNSAGDGNARVYEFDNNDWTQVDATIEGASGDYLGVSNSLNYVGDRLLVGAPGIGPSLTGATQVYENDNLSVVTGIENSDIASLKAYPVPAKDVLFVKSNDAISQLRILSANGSLILVDSQNRNQVDISALAKGVYLLSVVTEKGTSHARFIKD